MKLSNLNLALAFFSFSTLLAPVTAHASSHAPQKRDQVGQYDCKGGKATINCPNSDPFHTCKGVCDNGDYWYGKCYANAAPSSGWSCIYAF